MRGPSGDSGRRDRSERSRPWLLLPAERLPERSGEGVVGGRERQFLAADADDARSVSPKGVDLDGAERLALVEAANHRRAVRQRQPDDAVAEVLPRPAGPLERPGAGEVLAAQVA